MQDSMRHLDQRSERLAREKRRRLTAAASEGDWELVYCKLIGEVVGIVVRREVETV